MKDGKGSDPDLPDERELLAAAAQAVIAAFRIPVSEQLPPSSLAALRLLETALLLYEDGKGDTGRSGAPFPAGRRSA